MRALKQLLIKDIKDLLRDPRIFIPFIISAVLLPIVGIVVVQGFRQSVQAVIARPIESFAVVDLDGSELSKFIIEALNRSESVHIETFKDIQEAIVKGESEFIVVIPPGFANQFRSYVNGSGAMPVLIVIQRVESIGLGIESARAYRGVEIISSILRSMLANRLGISKALPAVLNPIASDVLLYLEPRQVFVYVTGASATMMTLPMFVAPLIVAIIGLTVLQIAATSMALENEVKTFETLLTLPIPRSSILLSKILGAFVVGLIGSMFTVIGFAIYTYMVSAGIAQYATIITPSKSPAIQLLLSLGIQNIVSPLSLLIPKISFLAMIVVSSIIMVFFLAVLGVVIGALSSDVRIASTFVGPLAMPIFIAIYFIGFTDPLHLDSFVRLVLLSIPITQTALLSKLMIVNLWLPEITIGIIISLSLTLATLIVSSRLLSMETLARIHYYFTKRKMRQLR